MEYPSYSDTLKVVIPRLSHSYSDVNKNDSTRTTGSCNGFLINDDVYCISSSSDDEIYGFDTPNKDKHDYVVNLVKKLEAERREENVVEKDVINGIEFLSFLTQEELMDYAKTQQDLRANASDDGLEILDDGTFSDISSNHAIVPTKTKDITRIKGWRNKHFAGINVCDDSGSSLRNDDDGFGDDFEIKSVHDESSEELESVGYAASTTSKSGFEGDPLVEKNYKRIDSPVIEDSNAVDNAEGFTLKKSYKTLSSSSLSSCVSQKSIASNHLEFSFDNFDIKGIFTSDKSSNTPVISENVSTKKSTDSFISPLTPIDRKLKHSFENKVIAYKPRVKQGFLERLAKKVNAENLENFQEPNISSLVSNNKFEKGIRWHVPKEKLLSGNIYDVEVSTADPKLTDFEIGNAESLSHFTPRYCQIKCEERGYKTVSYNEGMDNDNIAAFQSTTLEHYTTNLGKLHIDFTIPKLDAADNVTHKEDLLPVTGNIKFEHRIKSRIVDDVRAKTVAEKRKLLSEQNQRSKRKPKLSLKVRVNNEIKNSKRVKRLRGRIERNTKEAKLKNKVKTLNKKPKELFDEQGVITYGREKPLNYLFSKSLMTIKRVNLPDNSECSENSPITSKIGMILNIGVSRPLYKEVSDNVSKFAFDDDGKITPAYAAFSSSAVQHSFYRPFTVHRILIPVVDDTIKRFTHILQKSGQVVKHKNEKNLCRINGGKKKFSSDCNLLKESQENVSQTTNQFVEDNEIDSEVCNIISNVLKYVELKECFQNLEFDYDPDIPITIDKEKIELCTLKTSSRKRKKTKLQRQIEHLGGTFIAVQGEEGNEENLTQPTEEIRNCKKDSCKLGCVCYYRMAREEHCGKEACIFSCKCPPFSKKQGCELKSKIWLLPEVLRHRNVTQSKLAPVEREYHQTVIMSKDKKITIETKHKKRERKIPSKYKDEILFDFGRSNHDDGADDDCLMMDVEEKKQSRQLHKDPADLNKKRLSVPFPSSIQTNLKKPSIVDNGFKIKQCHVLVEQNEAIDKMAQGLSCTPGVHITDCNKYMESPRKRQNNNKSRNVARKKTGSFKSHNFDLENSCSRTQEVRNNYALRNLLGKIRTKNFILYPSVLHGSNKPEFFLPFNNSHIVKEDLVEKCSTDNEGENEIEEKSPNEEERGLQIEFVHSIPPHLFENQGAVDQEENTNTKNHCPIDERETAESNQRKDSSELLNHFVNKNREQEKNTIPIVPKRFVYAALPKTDIASRWWVVELDSKKFSNLVYYSEKRSLSLPVIRKAIFDAEYSNSTIKLVLKNPYSPFEDKFGAYLVAGHKHLVFFGPYQLTETHGITAIKYEDEKFIQVPFTTKFSKSDNFKSLGISMTPVEESSHSELNAANAVWWYSTVKKGPETCVTEIRTNLENKGLCRYQNKCSIPLENELDTTIKCPEEVHDEITSHETFGIIDDITIEQGPVKIEPFYYYEESISNSSTGVSNSHVHSGVPQDSVSLIDSEKNGVLDSEIDPTIDSSNSIDWQINTSGTDVKKDLRDEESETELVIDSSSFDRNVDLNDDSQIITGNVGTVVNQPLVIDAIPNKSKASLSISKRSLLKRNVARMKTTSAVQTPAKHVKNQETNKRRKRKKLFTRRINRRKVMCKKEDINIVTLRKKIESLKEALKSTKLEARNDNQSDDNSSEIDIESDSTSLSDFDDDFVDKSDNFIIFKNGMSTVKRVIHKSTKISPKSKEPTRQALPQNLLQKNPREGPCPEKALLSLTPGIGYIPVVEFDPMGHLVIQDPSNSQLEHLFPNKNAAVDWLNQYFLERFIFRPVFPMQWVIMTGSIIRMLQPLNKDIFKYKARSLTIRPCGLELGHSPLMDKDLLDWERRELMLLKDRLVTTNENENEHQKNTSERPKQKMNRQYNSKRRPVRSNSIFHNMEHHNFMERMRRSELAELFQALGNLVLPQEKDSKLPKVKILSRAKYVCEVQKKIEEELHEETAELKKQRDMLNQQLKSIFADILNHEEKKKALDICKFIRCSRYKLPNESEKYLKAIKKREDELINLNMKRKNTINNLSLRPRSATSMKSSSSCGSLGSVSSLEADKPRAKVAKQPTEGVLVKSKLRALTAARPDLKIYPAAVGNEVINLIDDNSGDEQIIEIQSEEEDVIWLPVEDEELQDDDVEILSSSFKTKKPKMKFPKPKRKLPQPSPQKPHINSNSTPGTSNSSQRLPSLLSIHECPSTSSAVNSTDPQHLPRMPKLQVGPEFVGVVEHDYEPLYCEFDSGCSRTDPVMNKYRVKPSVAPQQFIPIQETSLVNCTNTAEISLNTPTNTTTPVQRTLMTPFARLQQIKLNNITPISKIAQSNQNNLSVLKGKSVLLTKSSEGVQILQKDLSVLKGKPVLLNKNKESVQITKRELSCLKGLPVLVRKSNEGIQITKLPVSTPLPRLTPLSAMPVTISEARNLNDEKIKFPIRENTVTLYHPSEEISVTKTVQFANMNSVQLCMPSSSSASVLSGPKMRTPKDDGQAIKVILPKRS